MYKKDASIILCSDLKGWYTSWYRKYVFKVLEISLACITISLQRVQVDLPFQQFMLLAETDIPFLVCPGELQANANTCYLPLFFGCLYSERF